MKKLEERKRMEEDLNEEVSIASSIHIKILYTKIHLMSTVHFSCLQNHAILKKYQGKKSTETLLNCVSR